MKLTVRLSIMERILKTKKVAFIRLILAQIKTEALGIFLNDRLTYLPKG